jgi:hypothetical protein
MSIVCAIVVAVSTVAVAPVGWGPPSGQTATSVLEGAVRDSSGGVITGAAVTLRAPDTNQVRALVTDAQARTPCMATRSSSASQAA